MVQKSQTTTWDAAKTYYKYWDIYYINWLAGFLNHQQYVSLPEGRIQFFGLWYSEGWYWRDPFSNREEE